MNNRHKAEGLMAKIKLPEKETIKQLETLLEKATKTPLAIDPSMDLTARRQLSDYIKAASGLRQAYEQFRTLN